MARTSSPRCTRPGFRTIAPDQRGMGESYAPADVEDYHLPTLVGDVVGIMDALGVERAHVVGHDWGGAVAWALAAFVPDRVDRLVALSTGHPTAFRGAGLEQRQKSWYMLLFQFVGIAEEWISADDFRNFREWANHPDADAVIADLRRPGALTAGLNWYRANVAPASLLAPPPRLPPDRRADDGRLEQRRPRAHRAPDGRLGRVRRGTVALRAHRRRRALDAARRARRAQRAARRLPHVRPDPSGGHPMILIVVKFQTKPEWSERWLDLVADFTAATRAEPGNLWFDWSRSVDDPNEFVLVEAFEDDGAGAAREQRALQAGDAGPAAGARDDAPDHQHHDRRCERLVADGRVDR